jgi:hypothetical protein
MKKLYILSVLILFFFTNCEKVVEIDVPSIEPKLIIDASFEVNFDENPVTSYTVVKLRSSADYFDEIIPTVTNATVFLTNLLDNSIINFSDTNTDGNYEPVNSFIPENGIEYELTVIYDNQTYKGTATKIKSTPITEVKQGDKTLFAGTETEVIATFNDDANSENYYLFDFSDNNFSVLEDRFFNGNEYDVPNYFAEEDLELPTTITIKMSGISKDYFTYFRILQSQSGENSGGPFETVPSSLLGNMINTTNEDNYPLGYFHISETDSETLDLVEKN